MMKMNLKKMVMAAAMAAFMVYAPAMAQEEEIILDETIEAAEEIAYETETAETELLVGLTEIETISEEEIPAEVVAAAAAAEAEEKEEAAAQSFYFENEEVIVRATGAELPENVQMQVTKLEEGSEEYEAAKQAAMAACGSDEGAEYRFYSVSFTADGVEIEESGISLQVEFKTEKIEGADQSVLHIDETEATDVTAQTEAGSNLSSVSFEI